MSLFIEQLSDSAKKLAKQYGLFASVMIAQAVHESGWGKSGLSRPPNNNLFGIKGSHNGQSVTLPTREYLNGRWVVVDAKFRKYPSFYESMEDNAKLLRNGLSWDKKFYAKTWKENARNYRDVTLALTGTYATDPGYARKLNKIIEDYNLSKYDDKEVVKPVVNLHTEKYTIKKGDTLGEIAKEQKTTVTKIMELNPKIKDKNKITTGDVIFVPTKDNKVPTKPKPQTKLYTIKMGDNLSHIAQKHKTSVGNLMLLNPQIRDVNVIFAGNVIKVPK